MKPEQLKRWRARLSLTQESASEALGVSARTLQDWEQGRYEPQWPQMLALACAAISKGIKPVK